MPLAIVVAKEPSFAILAEEQAIYLQTTTWVAGETEELKCGQCHRTGGAGDDRQCDYSHASGRESCLVCQ